MRYNPPFIVLQKVYIPYLTVVYEFFLNKSVRIHCPKHDKKFLIDNYYKLFAD